MLPSEGNEATFDFGWRALVFATSALILAVALTLVAKDGVSTIGFAIIGGMAMLVYFLTSLNRFEKSALLLLQILLGMQILPAPQYEKMPILVLGVSITIFAPSILWLCYIKRGALSLKDSSIYFLVFSGLVLGWLFSFRSGGVEFSLTDNDVALFFIVATSLVVANFLVGRVFSDVLILAALTFSSSVISHAIFVIDCVESGFSIFSHRVGLYTSLGPNLFAFCLDLSVPLNIGLALGCKIRLWRRLLFLNGILQLSYLVLTGTRGSIVSILAVLTWIAVYFRKHRYFLPVVIPIGAVVFVFLTQKAISRLTLKSEAELLSTLGRLWLLKSAWNVLDANNYLWGIGIDQFARVKFDFGFPLWLNPTKSMSSHNTYLEYCLGWGALALAGYLFAIGAAVRRSFRSPSQVGIGVGVALMGYSVHGFVDSSVANYPITFAFWLLIAVGISKTKIKRNQRNEDGPSR